MYHSMSHVMYTFTQTKKYEQVFGREVFPRLRGKLIDICITSDVVLSLK